MSYGVYLVKNRAGFFLNFEPNSMAIAALPLYLYLPETADASSRSVFLVSVPILFSERGTRHNRTQDETRSNAGGRSLKSSKIAG